MKNRRRRQRSADDETGYVFEIEVSEQSIAVQRNSINRLISDRIRIIFRLKFIKSIIVQLKSFSYLHRIDKKLAFFIITLKNFSPTSTAETRTNDDYVLLSHG